MHMQEVFISATGR